MPDISGARWDAIRPDQPGLSLFQKILLVTDGTVTELLSLFSGQKITAHKLYQSIEARASGLHEIIDPASPEIACPRMLRTVLLKDADGRPLLHAHSSFALDLMPAAIRRDLQETELPIGMLWRRERLEMYREILSWRRGTAPATAGLLQVAPDATLLARSYCLFHQGQVMGLITETFAESVLL